MKKKKKVKSLVSLLAVLAVLVVAYFSYDPIVEKIKASKADEPSDTEPEEIFDICNFSSDSIASFEYTNNNYSIHIDISSDGMSMADDPDFPVNTEKVDAQLSTLTSLTSKRILPISNKDEYGFDSPSASVTVTLKNGNVRSFILGDKSIYETMYYLLDVEEDTIYYVDSSLYTALNAAYSSLIQREDVITVSTSDLQKVSIVTDDSTVTITNEAENELPWHIVSDDYDFNSNEDSLITKLGYLSSWAIADVYEYKCEDYSKYGLDTPSEILTVNYTETDDAGNLTEKQLILEFGNLDDSLNYYFRMNNSSYVYTMTSTYHDRLLVYSVDSYVPEEVAEEGTEESTEAQ